MSAKWVRSKRWDDEHIPRALWPVKFLLRAFSSITLAVILLSLVVVYAILASVPIGLIALAPTYLLYGLTLVGLLAAAGLPAWGAARLVSGWPRGRRFVAVFLVLTCMSVAGVWLWTSAVWPALRYDPVSGSGLRLFAAFVEANKAITVRRLPILEMSELEFYAWWPLRVVLLLFIANLVAATVRRIEFSFPYIGVLAVHTGIVLIALGSIYYSRDKVEGDILLIAGPPAPDGRPTAGPPETRFFDHLRPALHIQMGGLQFQRPLEGLPRYNNYNLGVISGESARQAINAFPGADEGGRRLDLPVPALKGPVPPGGPGPDISFRVVGFAAYANPEQDWVRVDPGSLTSVPPGMRLNPVRFFDLYSALPAEQGGAPLDGIGRSVARLFSLPRDARARTADNGVFAIEYTMGMPAERWQDLSSDLPPGAEHALVVEVPGSPEGQRRTVPVGPGSEIDIAGYRLRVEQLAPQPPFPIITEGYRDAQSSVAIVHVTPPSGGAFDRWVYHRFPEISQDLLEERNERGMPKRRDADPAIRISYIDASYLQVYIDEPAAGGAARAIVRQRAGPVRLVGDLKEGDAFEIVSRISVKLGERWAHAESAERPRPVPEREQQKNLVGTYDQAMAAVEVALAGSGGGPAWRRVVWLPFSKYLGSGADDSRLVELPDGRRMALTFGRQWHLLPGFSLSLTDFRMLAYDHRGAPRDYQSSVRVECIDGSFESFEHVTKLNNPLRAPFMWSDSRPWAANVFGRLRAGLNPSQFKFSQAGWDAQGWARTQGMADQGQIPQPYAAFTILGVGNNPGIHIIAAGGILMSLGIPWAFYIKPLIMRGRKRKIQKQLAEGTYRKPEPRRQLAEVGP